MTETELIKLSDSQAVLVRLGSEPVGSVLSLLCGGCARFAGENNNIGTAFPLEGGEIEDYLERTGRENLCENCEDYLI